MSIEDDADLRDSELPDASDWSHPDEASLDLEPCPFCGREIYEDAEICHHCGSFISRASPRLSIAWIVLLVVAACAVVVAGILLGG